MSEGNEDTKQLSHILLAEDCETDAKITLRAFKQAGFDAEVSVVHDGYQLVEYLYGTGEYADRKKHPIPSLIVLDINMPRYDGFTVLEHMRHVDLEAAVPVIILSSSSNVHDIQKSYALGACGYIQKSLKFEDFVEKMKVFQRYWNEVSLIR